MCVCEWVVELATVRVIFGNGFIFFAVLEMFVLVMDMRRCDLCVHKCGRVGCGCVCVGVVLGVIMC